MKKSELLDLEITKTEDKIAILQERLKELTQKRKTAVNTEILNIVKEINCEPRELQAILNAFRSGNLENLQQQISSNPKE